MTEGERSLADRAATGSRLREATLLLERVRSVIDRVMANDHATNGETKIVEELDGFVPARESNYASSGEPGFGVTADEAIDVIEQAMGALADPGGAVWDRLQGLLGKLRTTNEISTGPRSGADSPEAQKPGSSGFGSGSILEPRAKRQKKKCLVCGEVVEDWPRHFRKHEMKGVLPGHRLVFDDEPKATAVSWTGCGECDPAFPCHEGRQRCLRLEPLDVHGALNDAVDMIVDLGTAIDEGIEGRIFGGMQNAMRHLSLRSRKLLDRLTSAKKQNAESQKPKVTDRVAHCSGKCSSREEADVHALNCFHYVASAKKAYVPTAASADWKIWPNCMQAPGGDVLFLADLRKLLATQKLHLVAETQNEADRAQLLASFDEIELATELRERSTRSTRLRASWKCGACHDTKKWFTGIACPVCTPPSGKRCEARESGGAQCELDAGHVAIGVAHDCPEAIRRLQHRCKALRWSFPDPEARSTQPIADRPEET